MLAIGRALMSRPKLLLLDEPSLGLSPLLVKEIFQIIRTLNQEGVTILLVEQNARMALGIAHTGLILENGRFVVKGRRLRPDAGQGRQGVLHGGAFGGVGQGVSAVEAQEGLALARRRRKANLGVALPPALAAAYSPGR